MKLTLNALAVLCALVSLGAHAAPAYQSCGSMNVAHSGSQGVGYSLACRAGDWQFDYTGSLPAGQGPLEVQYSLRARSSGGADITLRRTLPLPAASYLAQGLMREAVLLDSGAVALRDCPAFGCTLYRPMDGVAGLSKAAVAVTSEIRKLQAEVERLSAELSAKQARILEVEAQVEALKQSLSATEAAIAAQSAKAGRLVEESSAELKLSQDALRQAESRVKQLEAQFAQAPTVPAETKRALDDALVERAALLAERTLLRAQVDEVRAEAETAAKVADASVMSLLQTQVDLATKLKEQVSLNLELFQQIEDAQAAKVQAEQSVSSMMDRAIEAGVKLEAANLSRELAMQAAAVAHAETDALNTRNAQLTAAVKELQDAQARAQDDVQLARAVLDEFAILKAKMDALDDGSAQHQAQVAQHEKELAQLKAENLKLQQDIEAQRQQDFSNKPFSLRKLWYWLW